LNAYQGRFKTKNYFNLDWNKLIKDFKEYKDVSKFFWEEKYGYF